MMQHVTHFPIRNCSRIIVKRRQTAAILTSSNFRHFLRVEIVNGKQVIICIRIISIRFLTSCPQLQTLLLIRLWMADVETTELPEGTSSSPITSKDSDSSSLHQIGGCNYPHHSFRQRCSSFHYG
jgi:hypothetical protein